MLGARIRKGTPVIEQEQILSIRLLTLNANVKSTN